MPPPSATQTVTTNIQPIHQQIQQQLQQQQQHQQQQQQSVRLDNNNQRRLAEKRNSVSQTDANIGSITSGKQHSDYANMKREDSSLRERRQSTASRVSQ